MSFGHFPFGLLLTYTDTRTWKPSGVCPRPPHLRVLTLTLRPPLIFAFQVKVPTVALKSSIPGPLIPRLPTLLLPPKMFSNFLQQMYFIFVTKTGV